MTQTEALLRIAEMGVEHYRKAEDFQTQQVATAAGMLDAIVRELNLRPESDPPHPSLYGMYSLEAILAAIRALQSK